MAPARGVTGYPVTTEEREIVKRAHLWWGTLKRPREDELERHVPRFHQEILLSKATFYESDAADLERLRNAMPLTIP